MKKILQCCTLAVMALVVCAVAYAGLDTTHQSWSQGDFFYQPDSVIKQILHKSGPVCASCAQLPGSECYKKCANKPEWSQGLIFYNS